MSALSHGPIGAAVPVPGMGARGARVIQVIEVTATEGAGTPDDVARRVRWYYSFDGELLARGDVADGPLQFPRKMPWNPDVGADGPEAAS